jgi:hypothetical protein
MLTGFCCGDIRHCLAGASQDHAYPHWIERMYSLQAVRCGLARIACQ